MLFLVTGCVRLLQNRPHGKVCFEYQINHVNGIFKIKCVIEGGRHLLVLNAFDGGIVKVDVTGIEDQIEVLRKIQQEGGILEVQPYNPARSLDDIERGGEPIQDTAGNRYTSDCRSSFQPEWNTFLKYYRRQWLEKEKAEKISVVPVPSPCPS